MNTQSIRFAEGKSDTKAATTTRGSQKFWVTALYVCSIGGLLTGLTGLLMSALEFFGVIERSAQLNRIGTWLMVAAFPVTMFGAHAMDKLSETGRRDKRTF